MHLNSGPVAHLVLENGDYFVGRSFGHNSTALGEVCFNTSMTGYQEILTDPSYRRQIVTMTYPMIGNYGVNAEENESARIQAAGLIVREYHPRPSNFRSQISLAEFLIQYETTAMQGIDTRKLVLTLRREGALRGGIFIGKNYTPAMLDEVRSIPAMQGQDLVSEVTTPQAYEFGTQTQKRFRVAVLDFGVKTNILRLLDEAGFAIKVFPADTSFEELQQSKFDCYFLSNGPGDPEPLGYAIKTVQALLQEGKPVFGICLGHQLIGLASGRHSFKLKFGHRGGNQPVQNLETGRVEITAQNHGFAIQKDGKSTAEVSHINLNDNTVEGFRDRERPVMCVQYHPEAAPGPHDSAYLFEEFYKMVEEYRAPPVGV